MSSSLHLGAFAFWLNEHDERAAPPDGYTLSDLIEWKWPSAVKAQQVKSGKDDEGIRELLKEIGVETK